LAVEGDIGKIRKTWFACKKDSVRRFAMRRKDVVQCQAEQCNGVVGNPSTPARIEVDSMMMVMIMMITDDRSEDVIGVSYGTRVACHSCLMRILTVVSLLCFVYRQCFGSFIMSIYFVPHYR
jgi:hypothetical protein